MQEKPEEQGKCIQGMCIREKCVRERDMREKCTQVKENAQDGMMDGYEEKRRKVSGFQLTSDVFFSKAMEDLKACQEVIQILTRQKLEVKAVKTQYSIRNLENRSVVLDVLAEDQDGRLVKVEMHPREDEDHVRRVRYHLSSIDMSVLEKGTEFGEIPDTYLIYITEKDFIGTGMGINEVDRVIRQDGHILDNGVHELYVNLSGKTDRKEQRELLDYMKNTDSRYETNTFPHLTEKVRMLKEKKEGIDIMCDIMERERIEGRTEGETIKLISLVRKKAMKNVAAEVCADMLEENPELIRKIYRAVQSHFDWEDARIFEEIKSELH